MFPNKLNAYYDHIIFTYKLGITENTLSIGVAMGIAIVVAFVGVLAGVLLFCRISKHQSQSSKLESSSCKADPEYEEVSATGGERNIGLRENIVSGPEQKIELRENVAYGPVN